MHVDRNLCRPQGRETRMPPSVYRRFPSRRLSRSLDKNTMRSRREDAYAGSTEVRGYGRGGRLGPGDGRRIVDNIRKNSNMDDIGEESPLSLLHHQKAQPHRSRRFPRFVEVWVKDICICRDSSHAEGMDNIKSESRTERAG
jgi:hypothetical protein